MVSVELFTDHFTQLWEQSPTHLPVFDRIYTAEEKQAREKNFDEIQQKLQALQNKANLRRLRNSDAGSSFFPVFKSMLQGVFDFKPEQLEIILSDEFRNVSKIFFYNAREFGPELSPENIYQGLRNVWIMNGLQLMMDFPVEITPSVFAYSMIYPYSDNLLDDPTISNIEKQKFSERFKLRLHGIEVMPENFTEKQLFELTGMFEQQFSRTEYPEVYQSLYAIHDAQTESLQLSKTDGLTDEEIRRICFEKGGTSVLADGYLVAGKLNRSQEQALYGYGVYLQLLDDIQDAKQDAGDGTKTMCAFEKGERLATFVNQTIHFGRKALDEMNCFDSKDSEVFIALMNRSIETMIIESVGLNAESYPADFVREIEKYSPLHFEYIRQRKSESKSHRLTMFRKYFDQATPERIKSVIV
jgi:hypothetical protein